MAGSSSDVAAHLKCSWHFIWRNNDETDFLFIFARANDPRRRLAENTSEMMGYSVFERSLPRTRSGVDTGSRQENASKKGSRASVLIQSEPIRF
jgi:hypothetical protein